MKIHKLVSENENIYMCIYICIYTSIQICILARNKCNNLVM